MKTTLIITCCNKLELLKLCLPTILKQNVPDLEILVISDTPYQDDLIEYCTENNVKFHFTQNEEPRTWCVTANEGVELATGENIILCHAEIYHIDKVLVDMINAIKPKTVVHPIGYDDQSGKYLKAVQDGKEGDLTGCAPLNTRVSFIQGFRKEDYVGFDEDFAEGHAFEDVDFSERMEHSGCTFVEVPVKVVHLFHKRGVTKNRNAKWERNRHLLEEKRNERNSQSGETLIKPPKVSLIIFCYNRLKLLERCWPTIKRQGYPMEIIVFSDTEEQKPLKDFCDKEGLRVHFTGNKQDRAWCVSINEGVKMATGDIVIIDHAEMYHLDDTIKQLVKAVGPKKISHPVGVEDNKGFFLSVVNQGHVGVFKGPSISTKHAFIHAFMKKDFMGYDEEFSEGHALEDIDYYERALEAGYDYVEVPARVVHLYHKRATDGNVSAETKKRCMKNHLLLEKKRHDRSLILHGKHPLSNGDTKP